MSRFLTPALHIRGKRPFDAAAQLRIYASTWISRGYYRSAQFLLQLFQILPAYCASAAFTGDVIELGFSLAYDDVAPVAGADPGIVFRLAALPQTALFILQLQT